MAKAPHGIIWDRLKIGGVVPFLGAGASLAHNVRDPAHLWDATNPVSLPTGTDLAVYLAQKAQLPSSDSRDKEDLAKSSSYYEAVSTRPDLRRCLRGVLTHAFEPGPLHEFLASVEKPLLIVTTNYDTLLEQAFRHAGRPYHLVIYSADLPTEKANALVFWRNGSKQPELLPPNEFDVAELDTTSIIYKMHGTVVSETDKWDSFVITEEDYVEFLSRMTKRQAIPPAFYEVFNQRNFLFLGYGLRDWNLRVLLRTLSKHLAARTDMQQFPSWAVQNPVAELERELWSHRRVRIFEEDLNEFARAMMAVASTPHV